MRLVILGTLCFFVGAIFINNLYWNIVKESFFLSLLLGAGKNLFFGPLIYLYVSTTQVPKNKLKKHILAHLTFPFLAHLVYLTIKFGYSTFYAANYYWVVISLGYVLFAISLFYLVLGIVGFKRNTVKPLSPKVKRRYGYFMYVLLSYYCAINLYNILPYITNSPFFAANFLTLNRYVFMPIGLLINTYLLLFSITEFFKFKSFFVTSGLYQKTDIDPAGMNELAIKLKENLIEGKLYTDPNLTISDLANELQVDKARLRHYFKEQETSFRKYLNSVRVSEFKILLLNKEFHNYNLTGLSTMVGFQSEATFFRVFKEMEGVTPSEFQQKNSIDL
ncbi:helix-turn-helix transcriptional regulator [Flagellimonas sp. CMM7]|uniref:helix-turn-helix transcriptional regulator n=1 Tax=Flagellimonas sp. CMM7 TaxID=2654676 RepID=UPI0013D08248|nr:helix-turn-helix transcriptional regulator [Flagellimonas sp. CMM7]UII79598.1 helix-turn-helix transcriptional regulator [Flagellimonas sp. CMM7]